MSDSFDSEDKSIVEFQLGNKQLFFLFIGLLVIGAIIFFIGLRVGADSAKGKVALNLGAEDQQLAEAAPGQEKLDEQVLDVRPNIKPSNEGNKAADSKKSVQLNMKKKSNEVVKAKDLPKTEKPKNNTKKNVKKSDEAKKPEAKKSTVKKSTAKASGKYFVQIAAPTNKARAQKMITKLPGGRAGEIQEKNVKGKVYYRVLVGPYINKAEAEKARKALAGTYKGAYIQIKK